MIWTTFLEHLRRRHLRPLSLSPLQEGASGKKINWAAKIINSTADVCRAHQHLFDASLEHIGFLGQVKKKMAKTEELCHNNLPYRWLAERWSFIKNARVLLQEEGQESNCST
jgi:hypothetical protein